MIETESQNSHVVLQVMKDSLIASIILSLISHVISISRALELCIDEDVYQQRIASNLKLQILLLQNKYSKIRSSLIVILVMQFALSFIGLFAIIQDIVSVLFIYAFIMLILFIIELKMFSTYIKFSSLLFHYLATIFSLVLLLYRKIYVKF
jgi:hypothetical protein